MLDLSKNRVFQKMNYNEGIVLSGFFFYNGRSSLLLKNFYKIISDSHKIMLKDISNVLKISKDS